MPNLYYMAPFTNAAPIAAVGILSYNFIRTNASLARLVPTIADPFVNARRHSIAVGSRPLHDYVPLYWATHTPMQYVVTYRQQLPQEQLVFFVLESEPVLSLPGVWTSDGNAASAATAFYPGAGAVQHLDWGILRTRNCYSPSYKRMKCAEVLVPDRIPPELINEIHTFNGGAASDLRELMTGLTGECETLVAMIERVSANPRFYY